VDTVLGLSMTPTTVGLVLVEGQDADGATVERDAFEATSRGGSEQVAAAVLRTQAIAASGGHRLHSIGVTWTDDADLEAALLLESLRDSGIDNVVAVALPEASEALARGIGPVIGYQKTAVCVLEPQMVAALMVDACDFAVQSAVSHTLDSVEDVIGWLRAVFDHDDWHPQCLVVVGSGNELDAITSRLEDVLSVPVFAPAEPQLALARGAAVASAQTANFTAASVSDDIVERRRPWLLTHSGALTMLIAGVVTFVVSLSVAIGLQLLPDNNSGSVDRQVENTAGTPADIKSVAPVVVPVFAPALPPPIPLAPPPPAYVPPAPAPPVEAVTAVDSPPVGPSDSQPASLPDDQSGAPAPAAVPPAAPAPPPAAVPPTDPAPPTKQPGFLRRVLDHVPGLNHLGNGPADPDQVPQGPDSVYPPPGPPQ
jgi:hypothetical protein